MLPTYLNIYLHQVYKLCNQIPLESRYDTSEILAQPKTNHDNSFHCVLRTPIVISGFHYLLFLSFCC